MLRVGCDVGGTNTDAVLVRGRGRRLEVVAAIKVPTTANVDSGVQQAISWLLEARGCSSPGAASRIVGSVMVGTTHFINALVQRKGLARVALLRLCGPATTELPPFCDMPKDLRAAVEGLGFMLPGGHDYDGREACELDEGQVRQACQRAFSSGITSVAICSVFSPVNKDHEERAANMVREEFQAWREKGGELREREELFLTVSHSIGGLGLLERENATVLNASLRPLARDVIVRLEAAVRSSGLLSCPVYLTQNDGTVARACDALEFPIRCVQSGPVNSVRGAALLSGLTDALVVDVGGTTTDVGTLRNGFPVPSSRDAYIAGARTNFVQSDVSSIALGGGSIIEQGGLGVGPASVASELSLRARCFGGDVTVATDVAVVLGRAPEGLGRVEAAKAHLPADRAERLWEIIQERLAEAVDRSKGSAGPVDVVAVGGGSFLIAENLPGTSRVLVPQHASCANAVGAASAQVSGTVDLIVQLEGRDRARVLAEVRRKAEELAVAAGADPSTLELLEQEETPLAYLPGATTRVHIKAVGQLAEPRATDIGGMQLPLFSSTGSEATREASLPPAEPRTAAPQPPPIATGLVGSQGNRPGMSEAEFDEEGAWLIGPRDVDAISLGCGILGSGGGGSPYSACIRLKLLLESRPGNRLRVIQPSAVPDDGLVVFASYMGAPTVSIEKLDSGQALVAAQAVLRAAGTGKQVVGAATDEIGGGNGLEGLLLALHLDVPAVDADVMGRAFPELQMCTTAINGMPMTPAACADEKGSVVVVQSAPSPLALEEILRPVCTAMGCIAGLATRPLTGKELKAVAVPQTLSCAWRLGRAVLAARAAQCDTATAVCEQYHNGRVVFRGKVIDVDRRTAGGFARGQLSIRGASGTEWEGAVMTIEFQNENLLARLTTNSKTATKGSVSSAVVACVPDLICCLETPTGRALQTEELRYGLLVSVVALPAPNQLRTARAMLVVGPRAFGYPDVEYTPVGQHIPAPAVAVDLRPDAE